MTIMDLSFAPDQRRIVTQRRREQPPIPGGRGLLSSLITLCAVLGACSPAVPAEPEETPRATKTLSLAAEPQLAPELPVNLWAMPDAEHDTTVVAAGNGLYLVVWMEASAATNGPDIMGVRVRASDGARLDASPLRIATGNLVQYQPAVAFDGTNFLVVWNEIRGVPTIHGARVRASDGAVLDASPRLISRTPMGPYQLPQLSPAVAFDGTNYLVTWHGHYYENGAVFYGVQAIRVRASDGTCIEANSTLISREGFNSRVAYADGNYLVAWEKSQNVEAVRIHASTGQVLDTTPIFLAATAGHEHSPSVAGQGGEFLAVWIGPDSVLWGRRVRASDGVKLGSGDFAVGPAATAAPEVTFDGMDYRVLWQGTREGVRKALSTRVSSAGEVAADAELVLSLMPGSAPALRGGIAAVGSGLFLSTYTSYTASVGKHRAQMRLVTEGSVHVSPELAVSLPTVSANHMESAVAAGNGVYLVVWSETNSSPTTDKPAILGVRVRASDGVRLDATPLRIGNTPSSVQLVPSVAFDGTNFLVVWMQIGSHPQIHGARVRASDGVVLDPWSFLISRPETGGYTGLPQFDPAVAFDGTNYLVTWYGYSFVNGAVSPGILATRVRPSNGSCIEPTSTVVALGGNAPRVAYTNGHYLVAWTRNQDIEAARISAATGAVLDTPAIAVAATPNNEGSPSVAAGNGEFLVAWTDAGNKGLWARRVSASDGGKLGSGDISVGSGPLAPSDATFDGMDYRILWQGTRGGVRTLLGTRVSSQGEVATDAELVLSQLHPSVPAYRGGVAAVGPGHLVAAYAQFDAVAGGKVRTRLRLVSDEQEPESCDGSGEPSLVLNGATPLTLECGAGPYNDPGAQAFDACGKPIPVHAYNTGKDESGPGPNMSFEGSYSVSYAAWDAMGRTVNALRTVIVDDRTAPTLTLKGAAHMTHTCGSQWVDPGVQAVDACYGDISHQVWRTGDVNGWAVGTYTVTYSLTDSGGNSATPITRTVDVANCPW